MTIIVPGVKKPSGSAGRHELAVLSLMVGAALLSTAVAAHVHRQQRSLPCPARTGAGPTSDYFRQPI